MRVEGLGQDILLPSHLFHIPAPPFTCIAPSNPALLAVHFSRLALLSLLVLFEDTRRRVSRLPAHPPLRHTQQRACMRTLTRSPHLASSHGPDFCHLVRHVIPALPTARAATTAMMAALA